jgi:hypothetical protein
MPRNLTRITRGSRAVTSWNGLLLYNMIWDVWIMLATLGLVVGVGTYDFMTDHSCLKDRL